MSFVTSLVSVKSPQDRELKFKIRPQGGNLSQSVTDEIVLREAFVENTYALHPDHFAHTGIMIDIGANIGAVALLACELGAKRVVAYEPDAENFGLLSVNIRLNHARGKVNLHREAIWSQAGTIPLVGGQAATTSNPDTVKAWPELVVQVPTITLAEVLRPFEDVDVLKVDTEGAEYEILRERAVLQKARMIVVEFHTTTTEKFGGLLALLSLTHNLQVFGHYDVSGGQILAKRYE